MSDPTKVFFSYSRKDSELVLKLASDLRSAGYELWLDQLDIEGGERWDAAIEEALGEASHILAVLSPDSVASENVMDEISHGLETGKSVVPLLIAECQVPFRLKRLQHVDFTGDYGEAMKRLEDALTPGKRSAPAAAAPASKPAPSAEAPAPAPRASESIARDASASGSPSPLAKIALAAVAVAALGFAGWKLMQGGGGEPQGQEPAVESLGSSMEKRIFIRAEELSNPNHYFTNIDGDTWSETGGSSGAAVTYEVAENQDSQVILELPDDEGGQLRIEFENEIIEVDETGDGNWSSSFGVRLSSITYRIEADQGDLVSWEAPPDTIDEQVSTVVTNESGTELMIFRNLPDGKQGYEDSIAPDSSMTITGDKGQTFFVAESDYGRPLAGFVNDVQERVITVSGGS